MHPVLLATDYGPLTTDTRGKRSRGRKSHETGRLALEGTFRIVCVSVRSSDLRATYRSSPSRSRVQIDPTGSGVIEEFRSR
jgi:hypothetical protein